MTINLDAILDFFEKKLVFSGRQYQWDNSGKQVYLGNTDVQRIGFALDPSEEVIDQAINEGCELLITHHPLFFGKIKSLSSEDFISKKAIKAIQNNLSIVAYHTSLDLADFSLNDLVAERIGAKVVGTFMDEGADSYKKFVVFVPVDNKDDILNAMDAAGAGHIGNYSRTSFRVSGTGTFMPNDKADPFIGKDGVVEEVEEYRIETIVPSKNISTLIGSVLKAHPYEEVAYDVYPIDKSESYGLGRCCELSDEISLNSFIKKICTTLNCESVQHNATDLNMKINRFAVVTGSGASLWKSCVKKGIDVLLTGDMKHHDALEAAENGVVIIDAGHFATERIFMEYLAQTVSESLNVQSKLIEEKNIIQKWGL